MTLTSGIVAIKPLTEGNRRPICVHTIIIAMLISNFTTTSMSSPLIMSKRMPCIYLFTFDVVYVSGSLNIAFGFIIGSRAHAAQ